MSHESDQLEENLLSAEPAEQFDTGEAEAPPSTPSISAAEAPAPITASERFASMDVVRGFALCGILAMNILSFGLPEAAYMNPTIAGGFTGTNFVQWVIASLFFEAKMMSTFSMLFGAGLVIMTERAAARGASNAKLFYRRAGILLLMGMFHGYFIWDGDILYSYAATGMIAYLFRKFSPKILIPSAIAFLCVGLLAGQLITIYAQAGSEASKRVEAAKAEGKTPSSQDQELASGWTEMRSFFEPNPEEVAKEIEIYRYGSYLDILEKRAGSTFMFEFMFFPMLMFWGVMGRMLLGMSLFKLGIVTAERPKSFYPWMIGVGYGLGLPLAGYGAWSMYQHNFSAVTAFEDIAFNEIGSILVSFGHMGVLLMLYKTDAFTWLTSRFAAVGRMALTNYLTHSVVCTLIFNGYGFQQFGTLDRTGLMGVVVTIWVLQLLFSPIWLRYFKFGPVEWFWRTLTYGKVQPFRVAA